MVLLDFARRITTLYFDFMEKFLIIYHQKMEKFLLLSLSGKEKGLLLQPFSLTGKSRGKPPSSSGPRGSKFKF
ncbi:hypothetical protein A2296_04430 [candidate division CPR3 bacterium RIFOXYB2_FULL_35_8]|nr:MAG: hypothetical protein A2296_04430 [candidate division CPR3 bacterium RIFOXYB2_FULL_35_8]